MNSQNSILSYFSSAGKKLAVLIDPDKQDVSAIPSLVKTIEESGADFIFVGGSLLINDAFGKTVESIRKHSKLPLIIFPGSPAQISSSADAILLLSLISGRNPELLIGQHVLAAPKLKESGLEILPTGYMLIESGNITTASYISNTLPVPANKPEIAACTALAGEQLGMKLIYLDGGSGAKNPVPAEMIKQVKKVISVPLIVGGGIRTAEMAYNACKAGADVIVVGTAFEKDAAVLGEIGKAVKGLDSYKTTEFHQLQP
jgi:phosphoglycerol geranylgeranyltransferase